jgi:hypothetical protein
MYCDVKIKSLFFYMFKKNLQKSRRFHRNPPDSSRFQQIPPDSSRFRQTPVESMDSARVQWSPWIPPESTGVHWTLVDYGFHQTPLDSMDSSGVRQSPPESTGLWLTLLCDNLSHYVTNLLLFVTNAGVRRSPVESSGVHGLRRSMWGSVKYSF